MSNDNWLKTRAKIETGVAVLAAGLLVLTLISREWIEFLTGWDPDGGSGALEWGIVLVLGVITVALGLRARTDWQKLQAHPA
jgi:hypothetical protein